MIRGKFKTRFRLQDVSYGLSGRPFANFSLFSEHTYGRERTGGLIALKNSIQLEPFQTYGFEPYQKFFNASNCTFSSNYWHEEYGWLGYGENRFPSYSSDIGGDDLNGNFVSTPYMVKQYKWNLSSGYADESIAAEPSNSTGSSEPTKFYQQIGSTEKGSKEYHLFKVTNQEYNCPIQMMSDDLDDETKPISFIFQSTEHFNPGAPEIVCALHFRGPRGDHAGSIEGTVSGTGYYVLAVFLSGEVILYEQCLFESEDYRGTTQVSKLQEVGRSTLTFRKDAVAIIPITILRSMPQKGFPGHVTVISPNKTGLTTFGTNVSRATILNMRNAFIESGEKILCSVTCSNPTPPVGKRLAVGVHAGTPKCGVQLAYMNLSTKGILQTSNITLPYALKGSVSGELNFDLIGLIPTGTSVTVDIIDDHGNKLSKVVGKQTTHRTVVTLPDYSIFSVKAVITCNGTANLTPDLWGYGISYDGSYIEEPEDVHSITIGEGSKTRIDISDFIPYSDDPDEVRMTCSITTNRIIERLEKFNSHKFVWEMKVGTGEWFPLFSGVITVPVRRTVIKDFGGKGMYKYDLDIKSPWVLLKEQPQLSRLILVRTDGTGSASRYQVREILRWVLNTAGFDDSRIDLPEDTTEIPITMESPIILSVGPTLDQPYTSISQIWRYHTIWDHVTEKWTYQAPNRFVNNEYVGSPIVTFGNSYAVEGETIPEGVNYKVVGAPITLLANGTETIPCFSYVDYPERAEVSEVIVTAIPEFSTKGVAVVSVFNPYAAPIYFDDATTYDVPYEERDSNYIGRQITGIAYLPDLLGYCTPKDADIIGMAARRLIDFAGGFYTKIQTSYMVMIPHGEFYRPLRFLDLVRLEDGKVYELSRTLPDRLHKEEYMRLAYQFLRPAKRAPVII